MAFSSRGDMPTNYKAIKAALLDTIFLFSLPIFLWTAPSSRDGFPPNVAEKADAKIYREDNFLRGTCNPREDRRTTIHKGHALP